MPPAVTQENIRPADNGQVRNPPEVPSGPQAVAKPSPPWLRLAVVVLMALAIVQPLALAAYLLWRSCSPGEVVQEVALGKFRFTAEPNDPGKLRGCEFHIALLLAPQWRGWAEAKIRQEPGRFRQAVEEVLREARSSDFADPSFRTLRRVLRERLNDLLGVAAVTEVFITEWLPQWAKAETSPGMTAEGLPQAFPPVPEVNL